MNAAQDDDLTSRINMIIRDSSDAVSQALGVIYDGPQGGSRAHDVTIIYSGDGVDIRVREELDPGTRETLYDHFIDAFQKAGWGFSSSFDREHNMRRKAVSFQHPTMLTRW